MSHTQYTLLFAGHNPGIFTPIFDLQIGDKIYIQDNNYRSTYEVYSFEYISTLTELLEREWTEQPEIILITCYGNTRYLVYAKRIKMEYQLYGFG